ncbi:hypothetical protein SAMN05720487_106143 [Fibrobacter sp. UWT2]|uniref:hypothetical protein n=1 Tax=Fibrobacter sp. UWT2 TaxID=1896224 RepID=UPI000920C659|nr:hypothetical protein [Fibrobacter sp. UWT2]SHK99047.1 hypothetical protein SAMN05720487_106143 [Fibrobacter sp. UWT2]
MSSPSYLMASLPMIELGDVPPLTLEEFRHRCIGMLDESELNALDALLAGEECDDEFVTAYQAHEIQMKNVSGRLRAAAWGPEVRFMERSFPGYDVTFAKMIQDAFAKSNPMEKELDIDKARFWLVDFLAGVGEGTVKHVYAYAIKLQICERWARLSESAGDAAVLSVINANDPAYAAQASQE